MCVPICVWVCAVYKYWIGEATTRVYTIETRWKKNIMIDNRMECFMRYFPILRSNDTKALAKQREKRRNGRRSEWEKEGEWTRYKWHLMQCRIALLMLNERTADRLEFTINNDAHNIVTLCNLELMLLSLLLLLLFARHFLCVPILIMHRVSFYKRILYAKMNLGWNFVHKYFCEFFFFIRRFIFKIHLSLFITRVIYVNCLLFFYCIHFVVVVVFGCNNYFNNKKTKRKEEEKKETTNCDKKKNIFVSLPKTTSIQWKMPYRANAKNT